MYYVENNHEAIIPKDLFNRVQEELARRASKRKVMQKSGKTEQGKYSAKYALSELLVCGECGTPYKRVTWSSNGVKRIVWRCISRLEYGKKYCHSSPTVYEDRLQNAIIDALNRFSEIQAEVISTAVEHAQIACGHREDEGKEILVVQSRLKTLRAEQALLLDKVLEDMDNPDLNVQLKALADEKQDLLDKLRILEQKVQQDENQTSRLDEMRAYAEEHTAKFDAFDDCIVRRLTERITVLDADTIRIKFRDTDMEIEQKLC